MNLRSFDLEMLELIGLIIGDGSILYKYRKKHYRLSISGDVLQDVEYFKKMASIIYNPTKKCLKLEKENTKKGIV